MTRGEFKIKQQSGGQGVFADVELEVGTRGDGWEVMIDVFAIVSGMTAK